MKKFLTFLAVMLMSLTAINAEDLYLRGGVNGWNASADYKFTDKGDGTFTLDKTFDLEGQFKFADANWGSVLNFGSTEEATCSEQGVTINLVTNGDNISTDGKLSITKIVVDKNQKKATFFGTKGAASDAVYTIAGQSALMGADWDPSATANDMTDMKDGTYQLVKENISLAAGDYEYKAVKNHAWGIWEYPSSGNNKLTISEAGTYTVTFTLTPATPALTANAVKSGEPQPVETKYYITGNAALCGEKAWDAQAIEMDDSTHTFTAMAAGEYEMKITNGAWDPAGQSWGSAALSEECSAGVGDKDGNIHFIVETPNNVIVSIANGKVTVTGTFKQEEPAKTFDLTIVQDTLWSKDGAKVAAWIWADDLEGQWTEWATNNNDTLTLKVNEKADSIIFIRNANDATEPTWDAWNRIDAGEINECHIYYILDWNAGAWCE
ncbi:MAG: hypothetical protein KBS69_00580, partial [Bacteroidales bacterium]|nr:hypothetical protein [Candidatus Colicola caccequi]